jgi:hypothetical protein
VRGLLHRLAARAAGTTVAVRSDARLPFGGTTLDRGAAAETEAVVEQPSTADVRAHDSNAAPTLAQERADWQSDAPTPKIDLSRQRPQVPQGDASPLVALDTRIDVQAVSRAAVLPVGWRVDSSLPPRLVEGSPADARQIAASHVEGMSETTRRAPNQRTHEPLRSADVPRFISEPSLLIPTAVSHRAPATRVTSPISTRQATAPNSIAHTAESEEATEVHIHIGRIDVTAVHEPALPGRQQAATRSPMSLDAYLAKRGRT